MTMKVPIARITDAMTPKAANHFGRYADLHQSTANTAEPKPAKTKAEL